MATTGIRVFAGLSNPGEQYEKTRHNAGAWWINALAHSSASSLRLEKKFTGAYGKIEAPTRAHLLIPHTFMNLSGQSIVACLHYFDIAPEQLLVAHDDLDLPVGSIRLKFGGGDGGHNGLKDIIRHLNTKDFFRLRIGIGRPEKNGAPIVDYVLHAPSTEDRKKIQDALLRACDYFPDLIQGHFEKIMQHLHTDIK